jgi:hypothetical protein
MTSFALVTQKSIYDKLSADILTIPIYDDVPQPSDGGKKTDFPYITIGEDVTTYNDTDTDRSVNVSITIHVWSRSRGRKETKEIQALIYDSLHNSNIVQAGYNFVIITEQNSTTQLDPDGRTRHGIQTFNLIIEED